jgi:hypothetical protein
LKEKRTCSNCIRGSSIAVNNDILCRDKGVVSPDYVCSQHKFSPVPKTFKEMNYKCIDCDNFILNIHCADETQSVGLCQLFSVRQFNGHDKNACSKFVKRKQSEVS